MAEERIVENVHKMFNKELIFVFPHMEDKETLIERLGSAAVERALVLPSFTKAVIDREKDYPTGLSTEYIDLAVPHTDACHVIQQAIIVAKLDDPVTFVAMGSDDKTVAAKYVFLLLLKNDGEQVPLLQKLMDMCSDKDATDALKKADTPEEIFKVIYEYYCAG